MRHPADVVPSSVAVASPRSRRGEAGVSLVELTISIAVLSVVMAAAMSFIVTSYRYTEFNRDKIFAYEKAVSIITEMQAFLETGGVEAASDLDSFEDGTSVRAALTITKMSNDPTQYVPPNHPASGNIPTLGYWRWYRRISVNPFPGVNSRDLRIVTVRMYRGADGYDPTDTTHPPTKYAEVSSVLRTVADAYPTTQVYDLYLLAAENVPGWWVFMDAIKPFVENTVEDLEARNPGLRFRTHWITKLGYGRDPWYRPYWNYRLDSYQDVPWVHFYPARMPPLQTNVISSAYYYVPESNRGWVRNDDVAAPPNALYGADDAVAGEDNGYNVAYSVPDEFGNPIANPHFNPFPYTLADHFNHCMRSVDAEAWFRLRRDFTNDIDTDLDGDVDDADHDFSGATGYESDAEPTWHMLIDRMKSSPSLYRNAIFINLHGELLPMPPMRSYSDAAKDPRPAITTARSANDFYSATASPAAWVGGHPGVRVVTHPEEQRTLRGATSGTSDDVILRVYAYLDDPNDASCPDVLADPIDIQIYGVDAAQRVENGAGQVFNMSMAPWFPPADRSQWAWYGFPTSWWYGATTGAGYLRVQAVQGGVDVDPVTAPDGVRDTYSWFDPYPIGLGERVFTNRSPVPWEWFTPTLYLPGGPPYVMAGTASRPGFILGHYSAYVGNIVQPGPKPIYRVGYVPPSMDPEGVGYTMLRLYNTPLRSPTVGNQGLRMDHGSQTNNYRLYGREYIPTTCEAGNNFTQDLTTSTLSVEKNTARWKITLRRAALDLGVRVRNPRTGEWVLITQPDPDHPADPNDSDHFPLTITTRIGSRVQDYNNDGVVDPNNVEDTEEHYLSRTSWGGANWNASAMTTMEVIDRALYPGAMRPDPAADATIGPTAYTYIGGLRVRIPNGLELPPTTGVRAGLPFTPPATNRPENISTTYTWWSDRAADVPASERFQFQGDPRHSPYKDFKTGDFPHAYNWYFDNLRTSGQDALARWPGFDASRINHSAGDTSEGWQQRYEIDVPRLMMVLRESLAESNMLWTTLTGWSYYYLGIGNEIGYDAANNYSNSIPVSRMPWGQGSGVIGYEQSIIDGSPAGNNGAGVKLVRSQNTARWLRDGSGTARSYWWGANWLGEQYPDDMYATWVENGNLPGGSAGTAFFRTLRSNLRRNNSDVDTQPVSMPFGTRFGDRLMIRRTADMGSTSFFNIGTSGSTFRHSSQSSVENASLTSIVGGGNDLAAGYSFPLPQRSKVSRPFVLNGSGAPNEFGQIEYSGSRYTAYNTLEFYRHDNGQIGSALIVNRLTSQTGNGAFIVVNGIDRAAESGSAFISRYSMVSLIHSFLAAGFQNDALGVTAANRIRQLPRVEITHPTIIAELDNPTTIPVRWTQRWVRWDGEKYTNQYGAGFVENEADLQFVPMWSSDNGRTWISMVDNATIVTPGVRPTNPALIRANMAGDDLYDWATPGALFPQSSYLVRVDCYRGNNALHYSFHQEKIYISRPATP